MSAPAITLGIGEVLITQSASVLGISSMDNKTLFGIVQKASDLSDNAVVGSAVSYDASKIKDRLLYGSTIYVLINEEFISGVEDYAP